MNFEALIDVLFAICVAVGVGVHHHDTSLGFLSYFILVELAGIRRTLTKDNLANWVRK